MTEGRMIARQFLEKTEELYGQKDARTRHLKPPGQHHEEEEEPVDQTQRTLTDPGDMMVSSLENDECEEPARKR